MRVYVGGEGVNVRGYGGPLVWGGEGVAHGGEGVFGWGYMVVGAYQRGTCVWGGCSGVYV